MSSFAKFVKQPRSTNAAFGPTDHYQRRTERRWKRERNGLLPSIADIADPENLINVFRHLQTHAGQAPGPDGIAYSLLSASEIGSCMRGLSAFLRSGRYRPAPSRQVKIPKANGTGHRTLSLPNILDRVVGAALNAALPPVWEKVFLPASMGFRPRLGPWEMLIRLERMMIETDRWVLTIDDIKDAFDHVPLETLLHDHRHHLQDQKLLDLIEVVIRGGSHLDRTEGIEQGNAYSPTCLNVRLHHVHDLALEQDQPSPSWLRYADNLVYLTKDVPEGLQVLQRSQALLQSSGFTLKGEDGPPTDLREKEAHLLGFCLSYREGRVAYGLDDGAWIGLKQNLERSHETPNPPLTAAQAVRGWIGAYGPAFEGTRSEGLEQVLEIATHYGFRELATPEELWRDWQSSWQRWQRRRKAPCYRL